jgi:hypothetical protein
MLDIDLKRFGRLMATGPRPTLRAFGTLPYLRMQPLPSLRATLLSLRLGSFFLCSVDSGPAGLLPMALYLELRVAAGYAVRAAWIHDAQDMLRELLFPRE